MRRNRPAATNATLAAAGYTIGRKVVAGLIDHATARAALLTAATALVTCECGCTCQECERISDAGLTAGARNPFTRKEVA